MVVVVVVMRKRQSNLDRFDFTYLAFSISFLLLFAQTHTHNNNNNSNNHKLVQVCIDYYHNLTKPALQINKITRDKRKRGRQKSISNNVVDDDGYIYRKSIDQLMAKSIIRSFMMIYGQKIHHPSLCVFFFWFSNFWNSFFIFHNVDNKIESSFYFIFCCWEIVLFVVVKIRKQIDIHQFQ